MKILGGKKFPKILHSGKISSQNQRPHVRSQISKHQSMLFEIATEESIWAKYMIQKLWSLYGSWHRSKKASRYNENRTSHIQQLQFSKIIPGRVSICIEKKYRASRAFEYREKWKTNQRGKRDE